MKKPLVKKKKPSPKGKKQKKMVFDYYLDHNTFRERPLSLDSIEVLGTKLVAWALKDESATKIMKFFRMRGMGSNDVKRWRGRSPKFDSAYIFSLGAIGDRREDGGLFKRMDSSVVLRSMIHYDEDWKEAAKWRNDLKKEEEAKATTFNINMHSFSDKNKEKDADKIGDGDRGDVINK